VHHTTCSSERRRWCCEPAVESYDASAWLDPARTIPDETDNAECGRRVGRNRLCRFSDGDGRNKTRPVGRPFNYRRHPESQRPAACGHAAPRRRESGRRARTTAARLPVRYDPAHRRGFSRTYTPAETGLGFRARRRRRIERASSGAALGAAGANWRIIRSLEEPAESGATAANQCPEGWTPQLAVPDR
jgi:hypothetical protein